MTFSHLAAITLISLFSTSIEAKDEVRVRACRALLALSASLNTATSPATRAAVLKALDHYRASGQTPA